MLKSRKRGLKSRKRGLKSRKRGLKSRKRSLVTSNKQSKNNNLFRNKHTRRKKMSGGHYCIFETQKAVDKYGCNTCDENTTFQYTNPSRFFYYYGNGDTLFGFNSHIFKHLDNVRITTKVDFVNLNNTVSYSMDYNRYFILKMFIDEIAKIIKDANITYQRLKIHMQTTLIQGLYKAGPYQLEHYSNLFITWSKKTRLPDNNPPRALTYNYNYILPPTGTYNYFVQLHSLEYDNRSDDPKCTLKHTQQLRNFNYAGDHLGSKSQHIRAPVSELTYDILPSEKAALKKKKHLWQPKTPKRL
jgi:hypothetical protein